MATTRNIRMSYFNGTDYDTLYPETISSQVIGGLSGTINLSTQVTGTLPIANGGTGATSASQARSNLGITPGNIGAAASSHNHSASNITSGTLPLTRGGTGTTTASAAVGSLTYGATIASSLSNSYYFPCASSSSAGRRVGLDTLGKYIANNYGGGFNYTTVTSTGDRYLRFTPVKERAVFLIGTWNTVNNGGGVAWYGSFYTLITGNSSYGNVVGILEGIDNDETGFMTIFGSNRDYSNYTYPTNASYGSNGQISIDLYNLKYAYNEDTNLAANNSPVVSGNKFFIAYI